MQKKLECFLFAPELQRFLYHAAEVFDEVGTLRVKFEFRDGLLYLPISIYYDSDIELIGVIDTGSGGTAVEVGRFNIDLLSRNARAVTLLGVGGRQEAFA